MTHPVRSRGHDDKGALVRRSIVTVVSAVAMFVMLSGIAECGSRCPVYDENGDQVFGPDGNPLAVNCVSCLESNPPPCKSDAWSLAEGVACDVSNQPDAPDGTACDFAGTDDGICTAGVCDGFRYACTEQGIFDAITAGGGPHYFDCAGPTTVNTSDMMVVGNDVILDGEGNLEFTPGFIVAGDVTAELRRFSVSGGVGIQAVQRSTLILEDSLVQASQALIALGSVEIRRSTIAASPSGGIGAYVLPEPGNTVRISESLFLGVYVAGFTDAGTALFVAGEDVEIVNTTISGEEGPFGETTLDIQTGAGGMATLRNVTVLGEMAAIQSNLDISNSVVVGGCSGSTVTTSSGNIEVGGDTCGFTDPTDQVNVTPAQLNLGPLQDNGGPTQTYLPGPGSVAINAIPAAECMLATDQRGIARPQGGACDIGAVEVEPAFSPTCGGCDVTIAAIGYTTPSCGVGFRQVNPDDPDGPRANEGGCNNEENCASFPLTLTYCEPGTTYEIELFHTGGSCNRDTIDVVNYTVDCSTL